MKKILIIGSINMDMAAEVDHTPVAGETILTDSVKLVPGGKGANQAFAAGRLGGDVTFLGAVGADSYGRIEKENLEKAGVDVSPVIERDDIGTGLAFITVNKDGDNAIVVAAGANMTLSKKEIEDNILLLKQCDIVILQMEIPVETVVFAAKTAKALGKTVILDPAPVPKVFPEELYSYLDIIKPNETELKMLTGMGDSIEELEAATDILRKKGVSNVVVTLGGKGVYINTAQGNKQMVSALKVEVADTTAAGDTFTAAMTLKIAQGEKLENAVRYANYVSALVVTKKGAQSSIPTREEAEKFIEKIISRTDPAARFVS